MRMSEIDQEKNGKNSALVRKACRKTESRERCETLGEPREKRGRVEVLFLPHFSFILSFTHLSFFISSSFSIYFSSYPFLFFFFFFLPFIPISISLYPIAVHCGTLSYYVLFSIYTMSIHSLSISYKHSIYIYILIRYHFLQPIRDTNNNRIPNTYK